MRSTACLVLALALVPVAEAQRSGELLALEGTWAGSYSCSGSLTPMDLSIGQNVSYPDGMSATFRFGKQTYNGIEELGAFWMKVTRIGPNQFRFEPTEWVNQPAGYEWFSMTGSLENGGIAGTINHPSCSTFRVTPADR